MFLVREDDLSSDQTRALLRLHLAGMRDSSPPGQVFALDLAGLRGDGVSVWSAWSGRRIAGLGALKRCNNGTGEIKSMRTHPDFLRRGAATAILDRIVAAAIADGLRRLSLETGRGPTFEPALALYRARGFTNGPAFADYVQSDFNQFLHRPLS